MIIIADSGSTKTTWLLVNKRREVVSTESIGLNPYFVNNQQIINALEKDIYPFLDNKDVENVYFYGSGCGDESGKQKLQYPFEDFFCNAQIEIESDLLGAARAVAQDEESYVTIFGTGSNLCLYDGKNIVDRHISLGYILGDEGSACSIGKKILSAYFNNKLPEELLRKYEERYEVKREKVLYNLFNEAFPNRYLASFAKFASENSDNNYIIDLVEKSFDEFFVTNSLFFSKKTLSLHSVGSVAYYFKEILREIAKKHGITVEKTEQNPAKALLNYHNPYYEISFKNLIFK